MPRQLIRNIVASTVFDGAATQVDSGNGTGLIGDVAFSMETWINLDNYTVPAGGIAGIMCMGNVGVAFHMGCMSTNFSGAQGAVALSLAGGRAAYTDPHLLPRNQWAHAVVTKAAGNFYSTTAIYINGISRTLTYIGADGPPALENTALELGKIIAFANSYLPGKLATPRLYNRALTAAEVLTLYTTGRKPTSGCIGEWLMSEGVGPTLTDTGGTIGTGTVTSGVWTTDVPQKSRVQT